MSATPDALHIHPKHPATPITNAVAMEILVVLLLTVFFIAVRMQLSVERPGALQHTMEGVYSFVHDLAHEIIGHHADKYLPYLISLGVFILSCNLIGLVPGLESPTAVPVVPLGCAHRQDARNLAKRQSVTTPSGDFRRLLTQRPQAASLICSSMFQPLRASVIHAPKTQTGPGLIHRAGL